MQRFSKITLNAIVLWMYDSKTLYEIKGIFQILPIHFLQAI